jgi:hypothetical protein
MVKDGSVFNRLDHNFLAVIDMLCHLPCPKS